MISNSRFVTRSTVRCYYLFEVLEKRREYMGLISRKRFSILSHTYQRWCLRVTCHIQPENSNKPSIKKVSMDSYKRVADGTRFVLRSVIFTLLIYLLRLGTVLLRMLNTSSVFIYCTVHYS